jgi:hypothetical protein
LLRPNNIPCHSYKNDPGAFPPGSFLLQEDVNDYYSYFRQCHCSRFLILNHEKSQYCSQQFYHCFSQRALLRILTWNSAARSTMRLLPAPVSGHMSMTWETSMRLLEHPFGVSLVDVTNPDVPVVKFNVNHTPSFWREIKTYGHYAYAYQREGGGLLVIDLSDLPNSVSQSSFIYTDTQGNVQQDGHTVWIDENGRLFIFGGAYNGEGATIST